MKKYSVMLVEDELPARMVFRSMIERRHDLFDLVGEASDGKDGLALFAARRPQLIVTDITMPGMSGLDMLREIERQSGLPQPQVVILTCHQDFHYARQAIELKAASYLIKDDCLSDPSLLARTLEELTRKAESIDASREEHLQLQQKVRSNELDIEQNLFLEMLRHPDAESGWLQSLETSGIPVAQGRFRAVLLELDRGSLRFSLDQLEELKLWQFAGVNVMKELLDGRGASKVVALDKGRFFALCAGEPRGDASSSLQPLIDGFAAYLKMGALALEYVFEAGVGARAETLKKLATAPSLFFYQWNRRLAGDLAEAGLVYARIPEQAVRFWSKVLKGALLDAHLSASALEQERSSFYRQAAEARWDPEQVKSLYLRVFMELSPIAVDAEGAAELEASLRKRLELCQTFPAVHDATVSHYRKLRLLQGDAKKLDASIGRIVQRMHDDLSYPYKLEELAASINYSVPYFSSMFKKNVGESFVQYLTRLRIERAKLLLLTSDRKTFEIAEEIGFENYRSFNRIFKKETGSTPSEFKRQSQ